MSEAAEANANGEAKKGKVPDWCKQGMKANFKRQMKQLLMRRSFGNEITGEVELQNCRETWSSAWNHRRMPVKFARCTAKIWPTGNSLVLSARSQIDQQQITCEYTCLTGRFRLTSLTAQDVDCRSGYTAANQKISIFLQSFFPLHSFPVHFFVTLPSGFTLKDDGCYVSTAPRHEINY